MLAVSFIIYVYLQRILYAGSVIYNYVYLQRILYAGSVIYNIRLLTKDPVCWQCHL